MAMGISGLTADKNMNPITDPSPTDAVEGLKNLDDITLSRYAQDGNNPNSTYALVVLMQRKKARDEIAAETPTNTTVAQEVAQDVTSGGINQLQPQMTAMNEASQGQGITAPAPNPEQLIAEGVGSLPAPNVGQNYAGGGIVAFQDGGDVGSTIQSRLFGGSSFSGRRSQGFPIDYSTIGYKSSVPNIDYLLPQDRIKTTDLGMIGDNLQGAELEEFLASMSPEQRQAWLEQKALRDRMKEAEEAPSNASKLFPAAKDVEDKARKEAMEEAEKEAKAEAEKAGTVLPTEDKTQLSVENEPIINTADMLKAPESKPTSSYLDELKEQYKQAGVNEDFFKQDRQDIEAKREKLKGEGLSDVWMNVTRAGLASAAGTSRNAMENITKGLGIGFEGYIQDTKERRREEKELDNLLRANKLAEQADAKGDVREAFKIKQEADKIANDLYKNRLSNQTSIKVAQIGAAKKGDYEKFRDFVSKDKSFMVKDAVTGEMRLDERRVKKAFDGYASQEATLLGKLYTALPTIVDPLEREETLRNIRTLENRIIGTGDGISNGFTLKGVK